MGVFWLCRGFLSVVGVVVVGLHLCIDVVCVGPAMHAWMLL